MRPEPLPPKGTGPAPPPTVPSRPFGSLGELVSGFGLGLGPLAQAGAEAPWDATLGEAMACGVTVIDTAPRGARPRSEELLRSVLDGRRDGLFLSTRSSPLDGKPFDTSPDAVRAELEASLMRLGTDRIDLYQVHDVEATNPQKLIEVTLPALVEARERGDVRYIGASGGSLSLLAEIAATFPVDALLSYARFDLVDDSLRESLLPAAEERGIAMVNASPLHMGLLAQRSLVDQAAAADHPIAIPAQSAFEIADRVGTDLARLALEFAAQEERIATTLVGCKSPAELRANVAAFTSAPTQVERQAIEEIREEFRGAGLMPPPGDA